MKYTNKHNLPAPFVRAVENDTYDAGDSDFTATSLSLPPRAWALMKLRKDDLVIDVSSRVAAIIGQGTHANAERAARPGIDLCEERIFSDFEVDGKIYKVSAQLDLFEIDTGWLWDWKTTKAFAFSKKTGSGNKPGWVSQLNVGAEILRRKGYDVKGLGIIALLKDWEERKAGEDHPASEVVAPVLELWDTLTATKWIVEKIREKVKALDALPRCSGAETWGGKRCARWCDASSVCSQFKEGKRTGLI